MDKPSDTERFEQLIEDGEIRPSDVVGIIGKTEGNGLYDDYTRELAGTSIKRVLADARSSTVDEIEIPIIMSGGTGGIISPHATVFTRDETSTASSETKRLAVGTASTDRIDWEEIGTGAQVLNVADAVEAAMTDARIESVDDVHYVQTKGPLLTPSRINEVEKRGNECTTTDPLTSMLYSNGASSLGIAVALGEVARADIGEDVIGEDRNHSIPPGSSSAGNEKKSVEVVLLGNSGNAESDYKMGSGVMEDMLDRSGVYEAIKDTGIEFGDRPGPEHLEEVFTAFAKVPIPPSGTLRGRRIPIKSESNIPSTRLNRCIVGSTVAGAVGDPLVYVSGHTADPIGAYGRATNAGPIAIMREIK
jgi:cyanuric acid amidohydrolase